MEYLMKAMANQAGQVMRKQVTLFLKRESLPLHLSTPFASSINRLLSSATVEPPQPNPHFAAVDYLTRSIGLPSDVANRASKKIQHLKSPDRPDAVLQFLRQASISESDIRTAVSRDPRILCCTVEKNLRPNITKLQEVGFSEEDISGTLARWPSVFLSNFVPKVDYLLGALGSVENLSLVLKRRPGFLQSSLEKVLIPNLSLFREQLGLSGAQIVRLILNAHRLVRYGPESLKIIVERAEELGIRCSSPMFLYALVVASNFSQQTINAKVNNLKSFGFSQDEVTAIVSKFPTVLTQSEEMIGRKIEFLMKEVACKKLQLVQNPSLLALSLEKRIIPRSTVRKLLMSKGLSAENKSFVTFMQPSEKNFLEKYVLPYEDAVPGLHQAYTDACAGNFWGSELCKNM